MFFWASALVLTFVAIAALLVPLSRRPKAAAPAGRHDLEVYKDQLAEVERDVARGALSAGEAEEARVEISRRILKAGEESASNSKTDTIVSRLTGMTAVLSVPLVAWGLYTALGSPDVPAQPLQARLQADPAEASVEELVARAEGHLAANPDDGKGWDVIAPVYLRIGRADASVSAYRNAIRLDGSTAAREAGLGEALMTVSGGPVSDEAKAAFERALSLEAGYPKAAYYLAAADAQRGNSDAAVERLKVLLASLPADSSWRQPAEAALAQMTGQPTSGQSVAGAPASGPTQQDVEAANDMSDEDRAVMIEGMVSQLDARLRDNPDDREGWQRLVRSYVVLGRADDARAALDRGIAALTGDAAAELETFAATLGVARTSRQ